MEISLIRVSSAFNTIIFPKFDMYSLKLIDVSAWVAYGRMYDGVYVCTNICKCVCVHAHMYVCMCARIYVSVSVCTNICKCVCVHEYM